MAQQLFDKIEETKQYIQSKYSTAPSIGVVLGSGLGDLASKITVECELSYKDIPNFPVSTVEGHAGKLIFGQLGGKATVLMSGRFHYYEGYDMEQVTFPIRVMRALGVAHLFVSNAAGGMNKAYKVGDIVIIKDHINLFPEHRLG